ncbi:MAG: 1-phosphofructokinase family hexose kinase [Planctomycetota bacterium]
MAGVLTLTPNPLLDFVTSTELQPGAVNRVPTLAAVAEGKGVNVARILAAHGHRVIAGGFAGGHPGAWLAELVDALGVEAAFTPTAADLRVGFMAPIAGAPTPTTALADGFAVSAAEAARMRAQLRRHLAQVQLVIVSGSVPDPSCEALLSGICADCADAGVPCWVDSYGPAMATALACEMPPALAKPNRQEYDGIGGWDRVDELHLTDGAAPVAVRDAYGSWRVLPPAVAQINPVGSGDAYIAGLAHGQLVGMDHHARLRYAGAAGAANAARADVCAMPPEAIAELADAVRIDVA